jgi:2-phosphosulfolactate phosphatase
MNVAVVFTPASLNQGSLAGRPVLVLDILRATTTIAAALARGARAVLPAASAEDALKLAQNLERGSVLLAGERRSERISGFDLGNSPLEMTPEAVAGKTLVMTTTNGIPAVLAAGDGRPVILGAAVNFRAAAAAARQAFDETGELTILCAGRDKGFALEDAYAAGRFIEAIVPGKLRRSLEVNDAVLAARELVRKFGTDWQKVLSASAHGRYLKRLGFAPDLAFAAQENLLEVVPQYTDRRITAAGRG